MRRVRACDLFCGAGGSSTGLLRAGRRLGLDVQLTAVNHWKDAIESHALNHPGVHHLHEDLAAIDPRKAVPGGTLDLLWASPECTSHSYSSGGRPISEQSRATAWHPFKWCDQLNVRAFIIENVPQMRDWGPLNAKRRPIVSRRGEVYAQYLRMFEALGYTVEARVLNAADYGAATSRRRLFIAGVKGRGRKPRWPEPTHAPVGSILPGLKPWRGAREVIDLDDLGETIFLPRKGKRWLVPKTLERIFMGLDRFGGPVLRPWIPVLRRHAFGQPLDEPMPTPCAGGEHIGLATPVIVQVNHGDNKRGSGRGNGGRVRSVDDQLPTLTKENGLGIAQFVLVNRTNNLPKPLDEPMPVLNTGGNLGVVDARFITPHRTWDNMAVDSIDEPLRTLDGASDDIGVCVPVVTDGQHAQPIVGQFLVPHFGERDGQRPRTHALDAPMPAVTSHGAGALTSFLVKYFGTATVQGLDEPIGALTGHDRYGLVTPHGIQIGEDLYIDIRFRMLRVDELAGGMGFERGYRFRGTKKSRVKQIGNAVETHQAEALCYSALS